MRSIVGLALVAFACGVAWLQVCARLPAHPAWLIGAGVCTLVLASLARATLRPACLVALAVAGAVAYTFFPERGSATTLSEGDKIQTK